MKRNVLGIVLLLMQFLPLQACSRNEQKIALAGPQGKIACTITLPKGFNPESDQVPMVILMHGIFASKDWVPIPSFAKGLAKAGMASIRLDFNGHGKSEGRMHVIPGVNHTITTHRNEVVQYAVDFFRQLWMNN